MSSTKRQKKKLLKIIEKLFKYDLEEILEYLKESKTGNKDKLKEKLINLVETRDGNSFSDLRIKIRDVYRKNDRIKKSPKKSAKKSLSPQKDKRIGESIETAIESVLSKSNPIEDLNSINIDNLVKRKDDNTILSWINRQPSQQLQHSQQSIPRNINVVNPFLSVNESQQSFNTFNINNQFTNFNSVSDARQNPFFLHNNSSQLSANNSSNANPPPLFMPSLNPNQHMFTNYRSQQPINLSLNYNSSVVSDSAVHNSKFFPQNYSLDASQTLESLIEQQNLLLPQSFQDRDLSFNTEYHFKSLPKYKQVLTIQDIQIIGSLSDIAIVKSFNINNLNTKLSSYNWFESDLNCALMNNSLQIQLRFCYITDIHLTEQKDSIPEHLCIEVNGKQLYAYSENEETGGPFDISSFCRLGANEMRFWLDKQNFTWILPCAYQISIVTFNTPESFLYRLKQNNMQFLLPDFTKSLISLKSQQSCDETAINITITDMNIKVKLICPLSCRRIETPCRTTNCKHIDCFDAFAFFKMNDLKYEWHCPICHTSASYDLLRIDGYFSEILKNTENYVTEVNFKSDGTYELSKNRENESVIIELDDTIDDGDADECTILNEWSDNDCVILD